MDRQTHAVEASCDLYDAVSTLIERSITGVIVVDADHRPVGRFGEAECLALLSEGSGAQVARGTVGEFMAEVVTVRPHWDIYYVAGMFNARQNLRRFAVVDDDGKLVGVCTRKDILKLVHREFMQSSVK